MHHLKFGKKKEIFTFLFRNSPNNTIFNIQLCIKIPCLLNIHSKYTYKVFWMKRIFLKLVTFDRSWEKHKVAKVVVAEVIYWKSYSIWPHFFSLPSEFRKTFLNFDTISQWGRTFESYFRSEADYHINKRVDKILICYWTSNTQEQYDTDVLQWSIILIVMLWTTPDTQLNTTQTIYV